MNVYEYYIALTCHLWHINRMKLDDLLSSATKQSDFETGLLLAGAVDPTDVCRQLSQ
jgi:hypothetical protein